MLFADTSFWIAFLRQNDSFHQLAVEIFTARLEVVYTTDWVLLELCNYFASRPSRNQCAQFVREILMDPVTIVVPCGDLFSAAFDLYEGRVDKQWSATDCASFLLMGELKIHAALTTDHHFEQAGFEILLK